MGFHNRLRMHQATALLPSILKDSLGLNEHRVLQVLGAAMAKPPDPKSTKPRSPLTVTDTCFPSIVTICRESLCSDSSVRRALTKLIDNGYITKSKIPGRKLRPGKHPNKFENNRYHLVSEVWDAAFTPKDKVTGDASPSTLPPISDADRAADQAILDGFDTMPARKDSKPALAADKYTQTEAIIALLNTNFRQHPTFEHKDANKIMTGCVRACIDTAGAQYSCLSVFEWILTDEERCIAIFSSDRLGGFIKEMFKKWFAEFKAADDESIQSLLDELCQCDDVEFQVIFKRSKLHHIKPLCNWLKAHLGADLLELTEDDGTAAGTKEEAQVMMFRVSDEYRAARRLALQTSQAEDDTASTEDAEEEETAYDPQDDFYIDPMPASR
jgi:helix-turn-helix protein